MPTATYVARDFNVDPSTFGFVPGTVVGANPLDVSDGDTSHIETVYTASGGGTTYSEVTFRLEQESGPTPPTSGVSYVLTFDVEYRVESTEPDTTPFLLIGVYADSHGGRTQVTHVADPATYTLFEGIPSTESGVGFGDDILAEFVNPSSDQYWRIFTSQLGGAVFGTNTLRATYLRAHLAWGETASPLRLIGRGDTLGMGSGRLLGVDTRQNSIRLLASP